MRFSLWRIAPLVVDRLRDPRARVSLVALLVALGLVLEATGVPLVTELCGSWSSRLPLPVPLPSSPTG